MSELQVGRFTVRIERRGSRMVFGRRRREGLRLTIERDGSLKVTAPPRAPLKLVEEFVLANVEWIEANQAKAFERASKNPPKQFVQGEKFRFFGVERELIFESSRSARPKVELIEDYLVVSVADDARTPDVIRVAIAKFFDVQARLHLPERVAHFSKEMGVGPSGLSFRCQKTRWGSCSSLGHISFNWKLIFAPEAVIDYVVIHELAHLVHANHSKNFWDLVEAHDPAWPKHRRWLKDHQLETEFLNPR